MTIGMEETSDRNTELMLDGNALAGMLLDLFGSDLTACACECGSCGNHAAIGALLAFTHAPGAVLRCPACGGVLLRVVERSDAYFVEARGLAWLRIERDTAVASEIARPKRPRSRPAAGRSS